MKIGIVSEYGWLRRWDNYGTLLQNYALQAFLRKHGHETYWIRTRWAKPHGAPRKPFTLRALRRLVRLAKWPLWYFYSGHRSSRMQAFNRDHPRHFGEFFHKYVPHTDEEHTVEELLRSPPDADAYIVGSDQVWDGGVTALNFLGFGSASVKRIAYGVSAPWIALSPEWFARATSEVSRFDAVSVREVDGLRVCSRIGRNDAVHVVDPTLLLDRADYLSLVEAENDSNVFECPFVLAYFVNIMRLRQIPWSGIRNFAAEEGLQLRIVPLQGAELIFPDEHVFTPSPTEWLSAFDKCQCVVTNSFHGTLFAIVMHRPFLVVLQTGGKAAENCRFISALQALGLEGRILSEVEAKRTTAADIRRQMSADIDWGSVEAKLGKWRQLSADFLLTSLAAT